MISYAPGSRVVIRDEEWLVRRVDPSTDAGKALYCDGISELVRGRSAIFLTNLEGEENILVLDPAQTELVPDTSSCFNSTLLYLEARLRQSTPNDDRIHLGHRGVMNLTPYQLDPALQALRQPRQRILIADAVGLGKTLEAGVLASELIQRGRGRRILVITLKSMLTQFQKEFWSRFSIPLVRLDSVGLQRVRNQIPSNHNPFNFYDRSIISIDTLKNNLEYRNYLENAWWDIIIIDECHNVAARARESGLSRRAKLARMLSTRSDTLMLLSATPHDGSARSFASLMSLLDPTAISDPDDYTPGDYQEKGLVIRRFKKDIRDQVREDFQERLTEQLRKNASPEEEVAYEALLAIPFTQQGQRQAGRHQELQRVGMQKAVFSSPAAAIESTAKRIALLESLPGGCNPEQQEEIDALRNFDSALQKIGITAFSKFQRLITRLRDPDYGWKPSNPADRLVIFSERIETLEWLRRTMPGELSMDPRHFEILHGGMADTEQQELVDRFGRQDDPVRVLLCSDVASEGLNLHYFCHRLIHFDLPWSLMVFQQRNGRVDRFGQKQRPRITYLFTETRVERIKGDLRILEILQAKDEQANKNLGDPASFLHVYDPEKEVAKVEASMADRVSAEAFESALDKNAAKAEERPSEDSDEEAGEWLMSLFSGESADEAPAKKPSTDFIDEPPSLFGAKGSESDFTFAKTALQQLSTPQQIAQFSIDETARTVTITAPLDLQERLKLSMPWEARAADHRYTLSASIESMAQAIERSRQARHQENTWPSLHYLWPQHPVMEWLTERVLTAFGRHRAPVLRSPALDEAERAFILLGLIPNRKGQPLLIDWRAAIVRDGAWTLESFPDFAKRARLTVGMLPNSGQPFDTTDTQAILPQAVGEMRRFMVERQKSFAAEMESRLRSTLAGLQRLQEKQVEQLELNLGKSQQAENIKRGQREQRTQTIRKVFDEYREWVRDTMSTEPEPFIQVLAAVTK